MVSTESPATVDLSYSLEDKYLREDGPVFLTGTQALVRILIDQARLDRASGIRTAALISGYRGSPLGGVDQELWRLRKLLPKFDIRFEPGLNEDLGATMLWGAQQIDAFPGKRVDGVFSMWYGKGPGVDRTGDVFRNANQLGTSKYGGVLAVAGDDHAAQSSMLPHQTDQVFEGAMMPIVFPVSVDEYIEFGLFGYALSRFSGLWVGFKAITETVESGRSMRMQPPRPGQSRFVTPTDIVVPPHGFGFDPKLIYPAQRNEGERRLIEERLPAAMAFARDNPVDKTVLRPQQVRIGLVTAGKAHGDLMAALDLLGLERDVLERLGIGIYKIGLVWPIEQTGILQFAEGLEHLIVIEEKRSFVETQIKDALYNVPAGSRPSVQGKLDVDRAPLLAATLELSPEAVTIALRKVFARIGIDRDLPPAREPLRRAGKVFELAKGDRQLARQPFFCAGCPHNTSTRLPDGSFAAAGIGCHIMALGQVQNTATFCQMGGEGIQWVGLSTFTETPHMFVNLGDGTYQHSGSLAIRQAVAANTNVTFKVLFNDAVAMTGGQPVEGGLTVERVVRQVNAENVARVVVVTDEPGKYTRENALPSGTDVRHRDQLDAVQRELREVKGVTVLIYDQTCAAEKRRLRKRGKLVDPPKRIVINPRVCEGCGDCSVQSNCIAVEPQETELGRKRQINQSVCNKDLSCVNGFCPSFVFIANAKPAKPAPSAAAELEQSWRERLPAPLPVDAALNRHARIIVTGIGGTGVVTIGAILAMAAHLEGKGVSTLDFTGVAQKNGSVLSHVQIAARADLLTTSRVGPQRADVVIGCDAVVTASEAGVSRIATDRTRAVVNSVITPTAQLVRDFDIPVSTDLHRRIIENALGRSEGRFFDCTDVAMRLFGDAIATNMMMVGYAFQLGWIPLTEASLLRAIELNGASVELNRRAFFFGRVAAHDPHTLSFNTDTQNKAERFDMETFIERRKDDLVAYQNAAYAQRYANLVDRVRRVEFKVRSDAFALTEAVSRHYFKVLAYKDEYEVARLYTDGSFDGQLNRDFDSVGRLTFHMAPPLLSKRDPKTGRPHKIALSGKWVRPMLRILKHTKILRGTRLDPFGSQADRRIERALIADYESDVALVCTRLESTAQIETAFALLSLPEKVRGFGVVKEAAYRAVRTERDRLRAQLMASPQAMAQVHAHIS
jgi:indolepyruvate ferredoxin oxidoreductase